jgi:hypothetical protein
VEEIAIIIPYYKIDFFEATLSSLANQTNKRFTVYVGNDNSTKDPSLLLEKYANEFNFIYQKYDTNLGSISLVKQWERCIALSKNEKWIMILGDDDVLKKNVIEKFYDHLSEFENKCNVIRFSTVKINDLGNAISDQYFNPLQESAIDFLFRETRSSLSEYVFRKEQLLKTGFKNFPLAWQSDVLAVLEVSNFKQIYSINKAIVKIRISNKSISGSSDSQNEKLNATFQFYYYLLVCKNNWFTDSQKQILLDKMKNSYFHRKKSTINFLRISYLYIWFFSLKEYGNFLKLFWFKIIK